MLKIKKRFRCPNCGSLNIIRWGVRSHHQRYKCNDCGSCFVKHREDVSLNNRFVWFRKWVLGKQTIADISKESGYSERQLRRWFDEYLDKAPEWHIQRRKSIHLLIDGTWVDKDQCIVVYRDNDSKSTLYYRFAEGEVEDEIIRDLQVFKRLKVSISSFTTDGAEPIIRAIKYCYPHTTRQRCIVHIERECLLWITQHPRTSAGITLRRLVCQISHIKTNNDKLFWTRELYKWYDEYREFIKEKTINTETGEITFTHDSVRKAYTHLNRALPDMFKYIDKPDVPNNTNGLESFFGHLKDNLRVHRGMSTQHRNNFIKWYLYFANEKKKKGE
jgi:transposase-like protein